MNKQNFSMLFIMLLAFLQMYQSCNIGCLKCNTANSQPYCEICDITNNFFLENGQCFQKSIKFCTKYQSDGTCLQCSHQRFPNSQSSFECQKLNKKEQVRDCLEHSAKNVCAVCNQKRYLDNQGNCQDVVELIKWCKVYDSKNTCRQCQSNFHLSLDQKECIKSKVDQQCAIQQNLKCNKCKNDYFKTDQQIDENIFNIFFDFYLTQNFYYQPICKEIENLVANCEQYDDSQQCELCKVGYFLLTDPEVECKPIDESQSEFLIENCVQLLTQDTCYKCDQNYHPSLDRQSCIEIQVQNDCRIYSNTLSGSQPQCEQCNDQYFIKENNTCQMRLNYLVQGCLEYNLYKDECLSCGQYELSFTKDYCINKVDNCKQYNSKQNDKSISVCISCQDPFVLENGSCGQGDIQNCAKYDQISKQCLECSNQYYLTVNQFQEQECQIQQQIQDCQQYHNTSQEIQEFSCLQCESGFLLQNIINKCIEMQTQNCNEENQTGECIDCQQGYQKILQDGSYICVEKLNQELDTNCQQKETFQNFVGWEDYDNQQCSICSENFVPRYILGQCVSLQIAQQRENYIEGCISFDENMNCQLCEDGKVLNNNQCLLECPNGTIFHKQYIDLKVRNSERNFEIKKNVCIEKIYYNDEYLQNCDIRTRRAFSVLDIINREYCLQCDQESIPTIGHSFYRINLINSQFNQNKNYDEFSPLIKCQLKDSNFQQIHNCEYYGEINEFDSQLVCKKCKHGYRENLLQNFEEVLVEEACEDQQGNNCLSCKLGYQLKYFDSILGNGCYLPKSFYQNCDELIPDCSAQTYQQVPGDLMGLISCQKCNNNRVPVVGVKQQVVQDVNFNFQFSDYLFTHQVLPNTNRMIECVDYQQIYTQYQISQQQLDVANSNGFENCAIFGINKSFSGGDNNIHCLACKPGYSTPNKAFRSDVCQPIQNCEVAGNKVNSCEKLSDGYYWGVESQFYEMPIKIYQSNYIDKNCAVSFQNRGCIICRKGFEIDESLQCVEVNTKNCLEGNYSLPTIYLERNQINLLTFLETSNFGFGCYQCQNNFVSFNDGFKKNCVENDLYRIDNRFNALIDQGVSENVFVQGCIQYQLQDTLQEQLLKGNDCIKCESGKNLNTSSNQCEPIANQIQYCSYYIDNQCIQCQQGQFYLQNGQCYQSVAIQNCIEYEDQNTCKKCQGIQNQQYELIDNQCQPLYICNEQFITTDYESFVNDFFNGIKCDNEFAYLKVKKFQALTQSLEVVQCEDGYKVEDNFEQKCLQHNLIQNCKKYDQSSQRHLVFDLSPSCVECEDQYYLNSNQCIYRTNNQNCQKFQINTDQCEICNQNYYLNGGTCLPVTNINCKVYQQNTNKCQECNEGYILDGQQFCELYHFEIQNCQEYSNFGRYCSLCSDQHYLASNNLSCVQRTNDNIDFCEVYSKNSDECQSCSQGYFLENSLIVCQQIQTFVEHCERPQTLEKCYECEAGYYLSEDKTECIEVFANLDNCFRYIDQQNCYECNSQAELYQNQCYIPDSKNCLKYNANICEACAQGFNYDVDNNVCVEDNYEQYCQDCETNPSHQCSKHCSEINDCQEMTWEGICKKCNEGFILNKEQNRCYENVYDTGCEQLVEIEPQCLMCKQGYQEHQEQDQIFCVERQNFSCAYYDNQGNCELCKPGSYQSISGVCIDIKPKNSSESQQTLSTQDSQDSESSEEKGKKQK